MFRPPFQSSRTICRLAALSHLVGLVCVAPGAAWSKTPDADKPSIKVEPLAPLSSGLREIPWTPDAPPTDVSWLSPTPTFHLELPGIRVKADGWVAASTGALVIHLVVQDPEHVGRAGDLMWQGDFIRIAIDGRGDGASKAPVDTAGPFGPDDAALGLGMTPDGPLTLVLKAGDADFKGRLDSGVARVVRDEARKETVYDLRLPWQRLSVMPGAAPSFGLAVQVKDVNQGQKDAYLRFGEGANELRAGQFVQLAFAKPNVPMVAATVLSGSLWDGEPASVVVMAATTRNGQLKVKSAGTSALHDIPGSADLAPRRFLVSYLPARDANQPTFSIEISSPGVPPFSMQHAPRLSDGLFRALGKRIDALLAEQPHPLFERHLRGVRSLTETEHARMQMYRNNVGLVHETVDQIETTLQGFEGDAGRWQSYLDGSRSLLFAFISKRDATVQSYYVTLPKGFDPAKSREDQDAFPLFVELHGAGNPHPMAWLSSGLAGKAKALDLLGYEAPRNYASVQRDGYHLQPFGRGNSGYRDIGETDVWEALADFQSHFKTDSNRHYLFGFSMGGAGTWSLGSRTPDKWAAIAVYGASPDTSASLGLAKNLTYVPVWHWAGTEDFFAAPGFAAFDAELRRQGVPLTSTSTPNMSHVYVMEKQKEGVQWLSTHVRQRPARFTFVADTAEHRGVWGISVDRATPGAFLARFDCTIDGNTVRIKSQGTKGLDVRLGGEGLRLTGQVSVVWNGKPVYRGPPIDLHLPQSAKVPGGPKS